MGQEQERMLKEIKPIEVGVPYVHISATCSNNGDMKDRIKGQQVKIYSDGSTNVAREWWISPVPVCGLCQEEYIKKII